MGKRSKGAGGVTTPNPSPRTPSSSQLRVSQGLPAHAAPNEQPNQAMDPELLKFLESDLYVESTTRQGGLQQGRGKVRTEEEEEVSVCVCVCVCVCADMTESRK